MTEKKQRITYDIEPDLLERMDKHIRQQRPIKISRNVFISLAIQHYLEFIKKGDREENEKVF